MFSSFVMKEVFLRLSKIFCVLFILSLGISPISNLAKTEKKNCPFFLKNSLDYFPTPFSRRMSKRSDSADPLGTLAVNVLNKNRRKQARDVLVCPAVHGAMGCSQKSFKPVWRCHQFLSGFIGKGYLPRVSRQSRRTLLAFTLQLKKTAGNLS